MSWNMMHLSLFTSSDFVKRLVEDLDLFDIECKLDLFKVSWLTYALLPSYNWPILCTDRNVSVLSRGIPIA